MCVCVCVWGGGQRCLYAGAVWHVWPTENAPGAKRVVEGLGQMWHGMWVVWVWVWMRFAGRLSVFAGAWVCQVGTWLEAGM